MLLLLGLAGLLGGLLFAGQGAGIITWPDLSPMVNTPDWIGYGLAIAGAGLVLIGIGTLLRR